MLTLKDTTDLCRLLADASRQRLLLLLEVHALSAAELTEITGLAQSRVSTHLARLKRAGLIRPEKHEGAALYAATAADGAAAELWRSLKKQLDDAVTRADLERADEVLRARQPQAQTWAESVAGRMDRHYSPGRSWEATAHALIPLLELGAVLDLASGDGVVAELIAARCRSLTCVDISETVLAAARRRLSRFANVSLRQGDMQALPFADQSFDTVLALHALPYARDPAAVAKEAARVLKPGGRLIVTALKRHGHSEIMRTYDHANLGLEADELHGMLVAQGLRVLRCGVSSREPRPPYFEVLTAEASKPA